MPLLSGIDLNVGVLGVMGNRSYGYFLKSKKEYGSSAYCMVGFQNVTDGWRDGGVEGWMDGTLKPNSSSFVTC